MSITHEKKRALLRKFHQMDLNRDGCLDLHEVRLCVQHSGLPESAAMEFMALFDLSGDNKITLQEYITALGLNPPPPTDLAEWKVGFDSIDVDNSGFLTRDEIRSLLQRFGYTRCTEQEVDQWMREVDKDGDNRISFAEFCTFMEMSINRNAR
ncbi:EF hand [Paragonimus heterotremus]|uniref:EF hand n=1 Tax=Paragonimus heterotremus TaxID=100268 RepID=A0A8J4T9G3_9TREM|nr:EF hand [Paragonimus heterotremus]